MKLARRTFLRGVGGISVGLPLLDAMLGDHGDALANGDALPLCYVLCFGGFSLGCDDDPMPNNVVPVQAGPGYSLGAGIAPLAGYDRVCDQITVVSKLSIPAQLSFGDPIPPAGRGVNFHSHTNPLFTGTASLVPFPGASEDHRVSNPSSDQVVAAAIASDTRFASLQYRAQALLYNSSVGPLNRDLMSWRLDGSGGAEPLHPESSPRQAFDALFLAFVPDDPAEAARRAFEIEKRRSILDLVDRRMAGTIDRLGASDRARLNEHYEVIRQLEKLLDDLPPDQTGACRLLGDPGDDPQMGGAFEGDTAGAYDIDAGYSGEATRIRVFNDLVHMALVCDSTRVVTFMHSMMQSFMNVHPITGHGFAMHDMTHQGSTTQYNDVIAWHIDHFAALVAKLRDTPEGSGSVLDRCAVVYLSEGGGGPRAGGGSPWTAHSTDDMVMFVSGGAGGLVRGQHIVAPSNANHPANVLISAMHAVGVEEGLGDVEGYIPELFG